MRVVFVDLSAQRLCSDAEAATAYWGAGWAAVSFCLALLLDSLDIAELRRWRALDVQLVDGAIRITHRDAVVTLAPLGDDVTVLTINEEGTMNDLDHVRSAQVLDVVCDRRCAADWRSP